MNGNIYMQYSALIIEVLNMAKDLKTYQYNFRDKEANTCAIIGHMFNRTASMFEYTGVPDTIPGRFIELYAQKYGRAIMAEHNGDLYILRANPGGKLDAYYKPLEYIAVNPWINLSRTYEVGVNCCVLYNDAQAIGLFPIIQRYATMLTENELTLYLTNINARISTLLGANDIQTKQSAEQFIKDIEQGKQGVIMSNAFLESLKSYQYHNGASDQITQLIEFEQYIKGALWGELGLRENYNMKRESIGAGEAGLMSDSLLPLIDDMKTEREIFVDNVNKMFGLHVTVKLSSAWAETEAEEYDKTQDSPEEEEEEEEEDNDND